MVLLTECLPGEEILELENAAGNVCVTVIIPTHRLSPERRADRLTLKRAVDQAVDQLRYKYESELLARSLSSSLKQLAEDADLLHNYDGLGLYVSTGIKKIFRFPFQVTGKVLVSDRFDLRDLWYKSQLSAPYSILMITENSVKFWRGQVEELEQISDEHIPDAYHEEYLYEMPSRSSSYAGYAHVKSFEKDRSVVEENRMKSFLKKIDQSIRKYIIGDQPLILLAPDKIISWYKEVIKTATPIAASIEGNYAHSKDAEIVVRVWPHVYDFYKKEFEKEVATANELAGHHRAVFGIEACWRAASEGNAYKLLVEKDFHCMGYALKNGRQLFLHTPTFPHVAFQDAVHELMNLVKSKKGKIIFGENNSLSNCGHIALITRY